MSPIQQQRAEIYSLVAATIQRDSGESAAIIEIEGSIDGIEITLLDDFILIEKRPPV